MRKYGILTALTGILIGVLLTMVTIRISSGRKARVTYRNWQKLNLILEKVRENYVDTVDMDKLTDAAVVAALSKLDPHTVYLPPVDLEESETELAGNFSGIGIQFNVPNDTAIVLEVIPGGPSEKVGMLPGDRILKVDDKVIAGVKFPQDSMVRRMKGPSGTKVRITVGREKEIIPFDITRGKIPVHCVDASFMMNDTTGYIRLTKFSRTTYQEVSLAAIELLGKGMKKLIFDLRDNTGGYFDQALMLSDLFLPENAEIVYLQGLHRRREDYKASGKGILKDVELSVLINESSASSSEIFAGAIQDNDRGVIVGRRSFGKGLVQEPLYFTDGSGVRVTVARFYTPSGRCIQKPYGEDGEYAYDIYRRYTGGEMFAADSVHKDTTLAYKTAGGRTVFGGGGIIPDVFVPLDTSRVTRFFISCNKKASQMRFASSVFDRNRKTLPYIDNYEALDTFFAGMDLKKDFIAFAAKDGISIRPGAWEKTAPYLVPQLKALIARYSKLGENAFYKMYSPIDDVLQTALKL